MMQTEIIIIGAGPVGSALATELGRRGISTIVIESTDGVFTDPRLHAISIRTMELARKWGITEDLRNCGWPLDHPQDAAYVTSIVGHELARIPWPAIGAMEPPPYSPTFAQRCPQSWFNPILHRSAGRYASVRFLWEHKFLDMECDADGVSVRVERSLGDEGREIRGKYLVGCDGARSDVRHQLGIGYESSGVFGYSAEAIIQSAELAELTRARRGGRYTSVAANGVSGMILPYDGVDRFRCTLVAEPEPVDKAQMDRSILQVVGRPVSYEYLTPVLPWVNRERVAERFRDGRVFIAGDAAHTMPPAGGHGMNTGILDSFDLGWKLAAVLEGWADDRVLDSYEFERKLAAIRTASHAGELYKDWGRVMPTITENLPLLLNEDDTGRAAREVVGDLITAVFTREFNSPGTPLGYRYEGSPIIVPDGTPEPDDDIVAFTQTARPGHRLPHHWLADGRSTLDLVGDVYTLIEIGEARTASAFRQTAERMGIPLITERVEDPALAALFETSAIIVRPDQHIAWRDNGAGYDAKAVLDRLTGRSQAEPVKHRRPTT